MFLTKSRVEQLFPLLLVFLLKIYQVLNYMVPSSDFFLPVIGWFLPGSPACYSVHFLHSFTKAHSGFLQVAIENIPQTVI